MQEDQIYALEDYLAEYQQLVCKYREENEALRSQMADGYDTDAELPAPPTTPPAKNGRPPAMNGPSIERPRAPRINGTPRQPPVQVPDVPPLETSSRDSDPKFRPPAHSGEVALAAGESTSIEDDAARMAFEPVEKNAPLQQASLRGQVIAHDSGGAPRLLVAVAPLDATGRTAEFDGQLSLMLLAPDSDGGQQSLARWDFGPKDAKSAIDAASGDSAMRFDLQLPADTPLTESAELWVRLLPRDGAKLLTHVPIELQRPSEFSSLVEPPSRPEMPLEPPQVASVQGDTPPSPPPVECDLADGGWSIARPGEPAILPQNADDSGGDWRASSEPPPVAVAGSVPSRPKPRAKRPLTRSETPNVAGSDIPTTISWSPDRRAGAPVDVPRTASLPSRPSWSAIR